MTAGRKRLKATPDSDLAATCREKSRQGWQTFCQRETRMTVRKLFRDHRPGIGERRNPPRLGGLRRSSRVRKAGRHYEVVPASIPSSSMPGGGARPPNLASVSLRRSRAMSASASPRNTGFAGGSACQSGAAQVSPPADRWSSGRWHRTRNAASLQGLRGFESHPVRQFLAQSI